MDESTYTTLMLDVAKGFEVIAALVFIAGLIFAVVISIRAWRRSGGALAYRTMRQTFGSSILLGLEILVAGDLIRTVAVAPTLDNVVVLAIIVLIRTFLSFSLEIEIEGVPPWRRGMVSGATMMKKAVKSSEAAAS
uniref:Unannotated protein n=1 Tax=freshwater metagenome TaxID=449393 RepID=A0A6J6A176_9ZZZZ